MLEKDQVISGKYVVDYKIGDGGMGAVYSATHSALRRQDALKVLHAHYGKDTSFIERFFREARAMARLSHENIIRVFDVFEENDKYFIAMEYFEGTSLKAIMGKQQSVDILGALHIIHQAALALDYAHIQGIVHRDVKPGNILVDKNLGVKLVDFGIAATIDEATLTSTGQLVGSPPYMSPEQARGDQITERSDLFSLGMVFYELITGSNPFEGDSGVAIIGKLAYLEEEINLDFPDNIDKNLRALICKLVKRDPSQRFGSAREVALQLDAIIEEYSNDPTKTVFQYPVRKTKSSSYITDPNRRSNNFGQTTLTTQTKIRTVLKATSLALALVLVAGATLFAYFYFTDNEFPLPVAQQDSSQQNQAGITGDSDLSLSEGEKKAALLVEELDELIPQLSQARQKADNNDAQNIVNSLYRTASNNQKQGLQAYDEGRQAIESGNYKLANTRLTEAVVVLNEAYISFLQMPDKIVALRQGQEEIHDKLATVNKIRREAEAAYRKAAASSAAKSSKFNKTNVKLQKAEQAYTNVHDLLDQYNNDGAIEQLEKARTLYLAALSGFSNLKNTIASKPTTDEKPAERQASVKQAHNELRNMQLDIIQAATEADSVNAKENAPKEYQFAVSLADRLTQSSLIISDYIHQNDSQRARKAISDALALADKTRSAYLGAAEAAKNAKNNATANNTTMVSATPNKPTVFDIEAVEKILVDFERAYEAKDINKLKMLTDLPDKRKNLVQQIFNKFSDIDIQIVGYSINGETANAQAIIRSLKNVNGDTVTPGDSWRSNDLMLKKENGKWNKINWQ